MSDPRFGRSAAGVSSLGSHVVWCPEHRRRLLGDAVAARLSELLDEIAVDNGWGLVARQVMRDQVNVSVRVRPTGSPAGVARGFEGRTGRVLRGELAWPRRRRVLWSKSQLAAPVGYVPDKTVRRDIEHQWDAA